ncbi:hypothetical protein QNI16_07250 [Cytophagaceae bacterium YF14B1]|uniref:Uncharacterized protein n=1 Tax=Xanthocytophaga flava TaxID=3048013 RepID=A0AAE3QMQ6_9BACT|nr:hypothetical protein [Xanthocytophaga flavus]MDJ1480275.1 hypothetical protein [Xanthocytophaga flavus]
MNTTVKKTFWWIGVSIGSLIIFIGWVFVCAFLTQFFRRTYSYTLYRILTSGYEYDQFSGFFCSDGYLTTINILTYLLNPVIFPFLLFFSYKTSPYKGWRIGTIQGLLLVIGFLSGLTIRMLIMRWRLKEFVLYGTIENNFCYTMPEMFWEAYSLVGMVVMFCLIWLYQRRQKRIMSL